MKPEYSAMGQQLRENQSKSSLREGPASAERKPETQSAAASMNTATAMSGLRPWSQDWVMGSQAGDPSVKPLIPGSPSLGEDFAGMDLESLREAVSKLQATEQRPPSPACPDGDLHPDAPVSR